MQLGMIGLGRMGANLVARLQRGGHHCVGWDRAESRLELIEAEGAQGAASVESLVEALAPPRAVWVMLPASVTEEYVDLLASLLGPGDTVIDGGNSYYRDDVRRASDLAGRRIHYLDVGTSGGVFGLDRGFCLMIGGEATAVDRLAPIFATLAPGVGSAPRTPGRAGSPSPAEQGYLHCGPAGAGHFAKMVHNGIEYGVMAAFAEGFNLLRHANVGLDDRGHDAGTAPLADARYFRYDFDVAAVAELWRRGSVVSSWLLDLTATALVEDPALAGFQGRVSDSGEGRWTIEAAIEAGVPAYVLAASLFSRFVSRGEADFGDRLLSAMRHQFGGHVERS